MEYWRRRIHLERMAGGDTRVVPALALIIFDDCHVIGENPAEARIGEELGALVRRDWLRRGFEGETAFIFHVKFADHVMAPVRLWRLGR